MELWELTAAEQAELLARGDASSEELTNAYLQRIEELEPRVKAFVTVTRDEALARARQMDSMRRDGRWRGGLAGIPVAVKDNICTSGVRTTCSSRILRNFVPPFDATVIEKLKAAGAVLLGKTNMDEFAMGSSVENSGLFLTYNPWDLTRVPGGSSGGSAAAVAASEAPYALGSDTGGSVRQPASFCGVVGMKPTYGRVSRYGLVAFASSLDQIGPITRDVTDCALVLGAISGFDPNDSTSLDVPVPDYTSFLTGEVRGVKLGVPREYFAHGIAPDVRESVLSAVDLLEGLGASVEECSLPHTEYALSAYYLIAPAEASSNLARYDGVRFGVRANEYDGIMSMYLHSRKEGLGAEVKRRIMLGTYALSSGYYDAYYLKAQKVRTLIRRDFDRAFEKFDILVAPTSPTVAFKVGEKARDPLSMYLSDVCTIPVNLAGLPAISVPCGLSGGLPVGLQLIGKLFDEGLLLRVAHAYERSAGHGRLLPDLAREVSS